MADSFEGSSSTVGAMAKRQPFFYENHRQQGRFEAQTEGAVSVWSGRPEDWGSSSASQRGYVRCSSTGCEAPHSSGDVGTTATRAFIGWKLKPEQPSRKLLQRKKNKKRLLADGERRLEELLLIERTTPSPFSVPPVPIVPDVQAEVAMMQGIIDRLQEELAMMRSGRVSETVEDADDEDMVAGLPHKKSRVGPSTLQGLNGGRAPTTPLAITGGTRARPSEG